MITRFKLALILLFIVTKTWAQDQDFVGVENLIENAFIMTEAGEAIPIDHSEVRDALHIWITGDQRNQVLYCKMKKGTLLFTDHQIRMYTNHDTAFYLPVNSLMTKEEDQVLLSIYNNNMDLNELSIQAGLYHRFRDQLTVRKQDFYFQFLIIAIIMLLTLMAVHRIKYPRIFKETLLINRSLSPRTREEFWFRSKITDRANILLIFMLSFSTGLVIMTLSGYAPELFANWTQPDKNGIAGLIFHWFKISFLVAAALLLKWILIKKLTSLFKLGDFNLNHYLNFLRMNQVIVILTLIVIVIWFSITTLQGDVTFHILFKVVFVFIVFQFLILFLKLMVFSNYRFVHLFSYLCGTEILPFLIGARIFLN